MYECTIDQELADAAAYAPGRRCVCTHQAATLSVRNDVSSILKLWRHISNPTPVSWCGFAWRTILPDFIPIRFETTERYRLFWRGHPNNNNNKM